MSLVSLEPKLGDVGVVSQCTLTGSIKKLTYDCNSYCMVNHGKKHQEAAIDFCKKMNARLPLPKSEGEATKFLKITGSEKVWIGITDSKKSGKMAEWIDIEGNQVGHSYVNLRVLTFDFRFFLCFNTDPD